jgi:type IV secretory pathway TrbD component
MNNRSGIGLDADQTRRNRHFILAMAALMCCFGLAALVYFVWHQTWLAVVFVAIWVPGRWAATLLADANPPARPKGSRAASTEVPSDRQE